MGSELVLILGAVLLAWWVGYGIGTMCGRDRAYKNGWRDAERIFNPKDKENGPIIW